MLGNQKGLAMIEVVPLLVLFVLLLNFALGFFGIIHSGILGSIAARNYAFETFRNRADLNYLRDVTDSEAVFYQGVGFRYHGIRSETNGNVDWVVTQRPIQFTQVSEANDPKGSMTDHDDVKKIAEGKAVSDQMNEDGVDPVWIRTLYGICLNSTCGDSTGGIL